MLRPHVVGTEQCGQFGIVGSATEAVAAVLDFDYREPARPRALEADAYLDLGTGSDVRLGIGAVACHIRSIRGGGGPGRDQPRPSPHRIVACWLTIDLVGGG